MDYKYIEQLLERYWAAETTLEEEGILRTFFSQKEIPAELEQYRDLFVYESKEMESRHLGDDFDERILAMMKEESQTTVKAREISLKQRLMPLFKAAAVVAIILTIGGAMQRPWDASWNAPVLIMPTAIPWRLIPQMLLRCRQRMSQRHLLTLQGHCLRLWQRIDEDKNFFYAFSINNIMFS